MADERRRNRKGDHPIGVADADPALWFWVWPGSGIRLRTGAGVWFAAGDLGGAFLDPPDIRIERQVPRENAIDPFLRCPRGSQR